MSDPLSEETKANIVDLKVIVIVLSQTSEQVKLICFFLFFLALTGALYTMMR